VFQKPRQPQKTEKKPMSSLRAERRHRIEKGETTEALQLSLPTADRGNSTRGKEKRRYDVFDRAIGSTQHDQQTTTEELAVALR